MYERRAALGPPSPRGLRCLTTLGVALRLGWDPARVLRVLRQGRLRGSTWRRQWWVHEIDLRTFIARVSPAERAAMRAISTYNRTLDRVPELPGRGEAG
jgi:hypothetical protein